MEVPFCIITPVMNIMFLFFADLFLLFKPCIENTILWLNYLKFNKNNQFE